MVSAARASAGLRFGFSGNAASRSAPLRQNFECASASRWNSPAISGRVALQDATASVAICIVFLSLRSL
jgi:hypothetical protein